MAAATTHARLEKLVRPVFARSYVAAVLRRLVATHALIWTRIGSIVARAEMRVRRASFVMVERVNVRWDKAHVAQYVRTLTRTKTTAVVAVLSVAAVMFVWLACVLRLIWLSARKPMCPRQILEDGVSAGRNNTAKVAPRLPQCKPLVPDLRS